MTIEADMRVARATARGSPSPPPEAAESTIGFFLPRATELKSAREGGENASAWNPRAKARTT